MKKALIILVVLLKTTFTFSQEKEFKIEIFPNKNASNKKALDKKRGFKDIKIGNNINEIKHKLIEVKGLPNKKEFNLNNIYIIKKTDSNSKVYAVKNTSEYYVDNQRIDEIVIYTKNNIIESLSLVFGTNEEKYFKQMLKKKGKEYVHAQIKYENEKNRLYEIKRFYRKLFYEAFGYNTETNKYGNQEWRGDEIYLVNFGGQGVTIYQFHKKPKNKIKKKEKKAIDKF